MFNFSLKKLIEGDNGLATNKAYRRLGDSLVAISNSLMGRRAQSEPPVIDDGENRTKRPIAPLPRRWRSVPLPSSLSEDVEMSDGEITEDSTPDADSTNHPRLGPVVDQQVLARTRPSSPAAVADARSPSPAVTEPAPYDTPRSPSPVPTELHDPDSQDVIARLPANVKVRDYAYTAPYRFPPPPYGAPPTPTKPPRLVTELFDPCLALVECEFRWTQEPRTRAVEGKTLRRLLDLGWITEEEVQRRSAPMDIEALRDFDARPTHPWTVKRSPIIPTTVPNVDEKGTIIRSYWQQMLSLDKLYQRHLWQQEILEREQVLIAEAEKKRAELAAERTAEFVATGGYREPKGKGREEEQGSPSGSGKRRRLAEEGHEEVGADSEGLPVTPVQSQRSPQKRRRIARPPSPKIHYPPGFQLKQYPAGMHPPPKDPNPLTRVDTPPLEESELSNEDRILYGAMGYAPGMGNPAQRLIHPRHQKQGLRRTQTFAQLVI
ncbi:hypothetical protein CPC08DRAFT_726215 [Agrocybe pediades]|nr:hypothetical protein CPC08DRAFT_726215 [Agrocybe pediades]